MCYAINTFLNLREIFYGNCDKNGLESRYRARIRSETANREFGNGSQLTRYMIDHNVGVSTMETYEIKRVDSDYFAENTE